jgi:hypothetical protein
MYKYLHKRDNDDDDNNSILDSSNNNISTADNNNSIAGNNNNSRDIGTINRNNRIAATMFSLGTWFVSGIYV